jgi:O-antigen/teichoic acid export membrane protein
MTVGAEARESDGPETTAGSPDRPRLAARARQAILWTGGFQFFRDGLQFVLMLALVRLLPAEAYGQFGFVTTLLSFLTFVSFREFLNHTLQVRDDGDVPYQDHFTAGAAIQVALCVVVNLVAVAVRFVDGFAPAAPLLHVMSVIFLLDLPAEFRGKMLERALDFRRLRVLHGVGLILSAGVSLAMALAGWGAYALLVPTLVALTPGIWDLFVRARFRPTWTFRWDAFAPAFRFGRARVLAAGFVGAATVLESWWLAGAFGFAWLGIAGRATGLAQLLCGRLGFLLAISVYPVLTRVAPTSPAFPKASGMYLRVVAWLAIPAATLGALLADPLVIALYSRRWADVIPLLPLAMAAGAAMAIAQTSYTVLLALGRYRTCLAADAWRLIGTVAALAICVPLGLRAYFWGIVILHAGLLAFATVAGWRAGVLRAIDVRDALLPASIASAAGVGGVVALRALAGSAEPGFGAMAVGAVVFAACYLAAIRLGFRTAVGELVHYLPEGRRWTRMLGLQAA